MNKKITALFLAVFTIALLTACGNDDNNTPLDNNNNENVNDNTENVEEDKTNEMNNEEESDSADDVDHQQGLKFGETGTVISGNFSDNYRTEITPVSLEFLDEFYDVNREKDYDSVEGVYVYVTIDIKNTDDKAYEIKKIMRPSWAVYDSDTFSDLSFQSPTFDEEVEMDGEELSVDDEIEPGEEVTISYVYDRPKADEYYFAFGMGGDQIVTYAQWEFETADFE